MAKLPSAIHGDLAHFVRLMLEAQAEDSRSNQGRALRAAIQDTVDRAVAKILAPRPWLTVGQLRTAGVFATRLETAP